MSGLFHRAARVALGLVVAGGLGFGAQTALAASQSRSSCAYDPNAGRPGVSCTTSASCNDVCQAYFGPDSGGGCLRGCCVCSI